jgi:hypothetical protein
LDVVVVVDLAAVDAVDAGCEVLLLLKKSK